MRCATKCKLTFRIKISVISSIVLADCILGVSVLKQEK